MKTLRAGVGRPRTVTGVLWGTGGVVGSLLQSRVALGAPAVALWRMGCAAVLLLVWHVVTGRPASLRVPRRLLPVAVLVGVLLAVFQASYFAAVARLGVGAATLLTLGLAPVHSRRPVRGRLGTPEHRPRGHVGRRPRQ